MTDRKPLLERWNEVDAIVTAALDRPRDERRPLAREMCGADEELLRLVLAILDRDEASEEFLREDTRQSLVEAYSKETLPTVLDEVESVAVGDEVDRWRLIRRIGRGGMGSVYLAERADGQFEQRVALKVLRRGVDTEDVLARFRAERQILASLNHPNIARLLGGGATTDGRPYLVMELVEGEPITSFADNRRLTIDQRLRLFITVARAVQFAHRNLIVHRDIKPGNIMVANDGEVKLLDFGIAKLLDEGSENAPRTRTGSRLFTPEYASPEQMRGDAVTTASDVYQLGALLYRLICGRHPHGVVDRRGADSESWLRHDPVPPSAALVEPGGDAEVAEIARLRGVDPRRLRGRLRGDLDVIAGRALRTEPDRRYATAVEMADDIERHLEGRPIQAHADSWGYRARKFVRRHPGAVAAGLGLLIAASAYVATLQAYADRLASERNIAQTERLRAETAHEAAETERIRAEVERDRAEASLGRAEVERSRAEAAQMLAEEERNRVRAERARAEEALSRELLQTARAERVADLVTSLFETFDPAESRGSDFSARDMLATGIAQTERLTADPETQAELFEVLSRVHQSLGMYPEALALAERSLSIRQQRLGGDDPAVAASLNAVGEALRRQGDFASAEAFHRRALALQRSLFGPEHPSVAASLNYLGEVLRQRGAFAEAEAFHREALAMRRKLFGEEHPDVATSLNDLAEALRRQHDFAGAVAHHREALALRQTLFGPEHPSVAASLNNVGLALVGSGDLDGAEAFHRDALALWRRLLGEEHPSVATALNALGIVLERKGNLEGAERYHEQSLALRRTLFGEDHPSIGASLYNLGHLATKMGDLPRAEENFRGALTVWRRAHGDHHPDVAASLYHLGLLNGEAGNLAAAERYLLESLEIRRAVLGPGHPDLATTLSSLGSTLQRLGRSAEAEAYYREALDLRRQELGDDHPEVMRTRNELAGIVAGRSPARREMPPP